ncbi:zinc-binding alcohol dehydrogenase domain-containing protein cipB [Echria macrotheca]|uniref:Zinc-binding alcohol dehydrogenase domain-containing protein cipB n=1 Tax=Echria macrotheca TaxID=438768 RepID=A0AAJ0BH34_9PEZI|nr:zinc-binding alcohol dehydrogenase domain-containing protein cipB [Echria macrotheca]
MSTSKNLVAVFTAVKSPLTIEERPISSPGPNEVLIRNEVIALNPIDCKRWAYGFLVQSYPTILGQDVSGVIEAVGPGVTSLQAGDRVIAIADGIHTGEITHTAFQNFTVARANCTAKIPDSLTSLSASTIITGVGTAAVALYDVLGLPLPDLSLKPGEATKSGEGILIWGGASAVGSMAIQLARQAGLTIFTTASKKHHDWVRSLGADVVFDYHSDTVVDDIVAAAKKTGTAIALAADVISKPDTLRMSMDVLLKAGGEKKPLKLTQTTPWPEQVVVPEKIMTAWVSGGDIWGRRQDLSAWLYGEAIPAWLANGVVKPGEYRVIEGGLGGLDTALEVLLAGVSGEKVVVEL